MFIKKYFNILVTVLCILFGTITLLSIKSCNKKNSVINRLNNNIKANEIGITYWKNKYGTIISTSMVKEVTTKELLKSKDSKVKELLDKVSKQSVKIKNLEYILNIETGLQIDTLTEIRIDTVDRYITNYIDSLSIGDFHLKRIQQVGTLTSKYKIEYTPTLFVSVEHYKDGKWKLRNLFHRRDIRYKVNVNTSDNLLKPHEVTILKITK